MPSNATGAVFVQHPLPACPGLHERVAAREELPVRSGQIHSFGAMSYSEYTECRPAPAVVCGPGIVGLEGYRALFGSAVIELRVDPR